MTGPRSPGGNRSFTTAALKLSKFKCGGADVSAYNTVDDVRRWIGNRLGRLLESGKIHEPSTAEIWDQASPLLEKGLEAYDKGKSESTPDFTLNPFGDSKASCQKELDQILDKLLQILGLCGAAKYRDQIRTLQSEILDLKKRIGEYRRRLISAPSEIALNPIEGIWTRSQEGLEEQLELENEALARKFQQVEESKTGFRDYLKNIGVTVSPESADSLLLPIEDDILSMVAVISNVKQLTGELERLLDESQEGLVEAMRYYGVYVLLVLAVDRIEKHFVKKVDEEFSPQLKRIAAEARQIITDARDQRSKGGPAEILSSNIDSNTRTIQGCQLFAEILESQRRAIVARNDETQRVLGAAVNTYRTVRIATDARKVFGECQSAFKALRELSLPALRTFHNIELNDELQRLAERVALKRGE